MKPAHDPDEIIAVVNDKDEVVSKATRAEVHLKGLMHREVAVALLNSKGQMLMHKRADNGQWDPSAAGHFPWDMSYEDGAIMEVEEELGVKLNKEELKEICYKLFESRIDKLKTNKRNVKAFLVIKDIGINEFNIDKQEVAEVRWMSKSEIEPLLNAPNKLITTAAKTIIKEYLWDDLR